MILSSQPYIKVTGKISAASATPETGVASKVSRYLLKDLRFPYKLRHYSLVRQNISKLKMVPSNKIATFVGHYIPLLGYAHIGCPSAGLIVTSDEIMQWSPTIIPLLALPGFTL